MKTIPALYVRDEIEGSAEYGFAMQIVRGEKRIETRGYAAPPKHVGKRIAIVATYKGKKKSQVIGTAILSECKRYFNEGHFCEDFKEHRIISSSQYRWGSTNKKYGWILEDVDTQSPVNWEIKNGGRVWTTAAAVPPNVETLSSNTLERGNE